MVTGPRPPVSTLLQSLDGLWAVKRPGVRRALRPGANVPALDAFAARFSLTLPPAFRAFYGWHDGARDQHAAFEGSFGLCSLVKVGQHKRSLDKLERDGAFDDWPPGTWWNPSWIPFLQFNLEDHVCIDTRGTLGGRRGAVLVRRHADPVRVVLAPSFHAWLAAHVAITATGPDGDAEDPWIEHFSGRAARRVRGQLDQGYPARVTAKPDLPPGRSRGRALASKRKKFLSM